MEIHFINLFIFVCRLIIVSPCTLFLRVVAKKFHGAVPADEGSTKRTLHTIPADWIQPVCLPERNMDVAAVLGEQWGTVTGWGFTENGTTSDRLLQVSLPPVDMERCNQTYQGKLVGKQVRKSGLIKLLKD